MRILGERKHKILITLVVILLIGTIPSGTAKISGNNLKFGINYLSTHWHYEPNYLSDIELNRDFRLFRQQGFTDITLTAVWKYLEPSPGVYNNIALDDIRRICKIADKYKLGVIIDFHTLMHENSFTMPEWLSPRKFETVFFDQDFKNAWLNFLDYCTTYLSDVKNIESWQMMNEPARNEWACDVTIDEFVDLWKEMRAVIKSNSDRPISIRFGAKSFDSHFERDQRIFGICDYISLNWYEEHCPRELFIDIVNEIHEYCKLSISEFGFRTDDDKAQFEVYFDIIELFRSLRIKNCFAWMWRADYEFGNPAPPGIGFNLAKNINGKPRPAFYLLGNSMRANIFVWLYRRSSRILFSFNKFN